MKRSASFLALGFLLTACTPPKPRVPALTPSMAAELLHYNNKAQNWMTYVRKNNTGCEYRLDLPDQTNQPTSIDLSHIVVCNGRPSPKEFDASVSFEYDKAAQHWVLTRFAS
jgi:hypothetical protein